MPTIKGFKLTKNKEGKSTMTDGEGNPVNISPFRSATPEEMVKEKPEERLEGIDGLLKKSRAELDALAEEKGLDPRDYRTKKEVATAILEKSGEEGPGESEEESDNATQDTLDDVDSDEKKPE